MVSGFCGGDFLCLFVFPLAGQLNCGQENGELRRGMEMRKDHGEGASNCGKETEKALLCMLIN